METPHPCPGKENSGRGLAAAAIAPSVRRGPAASPGGGAGKSGRRGRGTPVPHAKQENSRFEAGVFRLRRVLVRLKGAAAAAASDSKASHGCSKISVPKKPPRLLNIQSRGESAAGLRGTAVSLLSETQTRKETHNSADFRVWETSRKFTTVALGERKWKAEPGKPRGAKGGMGRLRYSTFPSETRGKAPSGRGEALELPSASSLHPVPLPWSPGAPARRFPRGKGREPVAEGRQGGGAKRSGFAPIPAAAAIRGV